MALPSVFEVVLGELITEVRRVHKADAPICFEYHADAKTPAERWICYVRAKGASSVHRSDKGETAMRRVLDDYKKIGR